METKIKRIYTRHIVKINQDADVFTANDMMNNYNIRHLPVTDNENYLVGIISRSDFNGLKFVDSRFSGFKVKDVMSSPIKVINQSAKVSEAAEIMLTAKISSVLVAKDDELVGILTTDDLLKLLISTESLQAALDDLDLEALADEGWISSTRSRPTNESFCNSN
jgi:CBS domain-containing protein